MNKPVLRCVLLLPVLVLMACNRAPPETAPSTVGAAAPAAVPEQRARASYMVGLDLAKQLAPIKDEIDLTITLAALRDNLSGAPSKFDAAEVDAIRREFTEYLRHKREADQKALAARNEKAGEAFLADNARRAGVTTTASGLQYEVLVQGKGVRPAPTDTIRVHYIGRRFDGTQFDNSYERDHPVEVVLNQVIPGWTEGLGLMNVGSKYRLWLPGKLAYGDNGRSGEIEPGTGLTFEIELLEVAGQP